jgi:hypothetical protein
MSNLDHPKRVLGINKHVSSNEITIGIIKHRIFRQKKQERVMLEPPRNTVISDQVFICFCCIKQVKSNSDPSFATLRKSIPRKESLHLANRINLEWNVVICVCAFAPNTSGVNQAYQHYRKDLEFVNQAYHIVKMILIGYNGSAC